MLRRSSLFVLIVATISLSVAFFHSWTSSLSRAHADAESAAGDAGSIPATVIAAPPSSELSRVSSDASSETAAVLGSIRESGPAVEAWATNAAAELQRWASQVASVGGSMRVTAPIECYFRACIMTAEHPTPGELEAATGHFTGSDVFMAWPGGKGRTAPITNEAGVSTVSWILFKPAH
jgi:hypothetical protein